MTNKVIPNSEPPGDDRVPDPGFPADLKKWVNDSGPGKHCTTRDADRDRVPDDINEDGTPDIVKALYRDDSCWRWGRPGFDRDEFADAMYAWLRHRREPPYPATTISITGALGGHAACATAAIATTRTDGTVQSSTAITAAQSGDVEDLSAVPRQRCRGRDVGQSGAELSHMTTPERFHTGAVRALAVKADAPDDVLMKLFEALTAEPAHNPIDGSTEPSR